MSFFDSFTDTAPQHHIWMDADDDGYSGQPTIRQVVAANLARLMKATPSLDTNTKLFNRAGIPVATISRILNGKTACTIDMLDRIAPAFNLEPWQLLVPNLSPSNPQILRTSSDTEEALYTKIRELIEEREAAKREEKA